MLGVAADALMKYVAASRSTVNVYFRLSVTTVPPIDEDISSGGTYTFWRSFASSTWSNVSAMSPDEAPGVLNNKPALQTT